MLFLIGEVTNRFVFDVPLAPLIFRGVVPETFGIPADFIELPGPEADRDVLDSTAAFIFYPAG